MREEQRIQDERKGIRVDPSKEIQRVSRIEYGNSKAIDKDITWSNRFGLFARLLPLRLLPSGKIA